MQADIKPNKRWVLRIPLGIRVGLFLLYLLILGSILAGVVVLLFEVVIEYPARIQGIIGVVILFSLLLFLGYVGISAIKKTNPLEKRVLAYGALFQLLILPVLISSDEGLMFYYYLPSIVTDLSLSGVFIAIGGVILLYLVLIVSNAILLGFLMGSSKLEIGLRKWFDKSWVGRLIKEIDHYLYVDSDVMSQVYKPLRGVRKLLAPFPITISICLIKLFITTAFILEFVGAPPFNVNYIAAALIVFGQIVHFYSPPLSRKLKYDLILAGISLIASSALISIINYIISFAADILDSNGQNNIVRFLYSIVNYLGLFVLIGFILFVKHSKVFFNKRIPKERDQLMKWVRRNSILFIPVIIFVVGDTLQLVLFIYMLWRFHMVNWLFERPILYFRSFVSDKKKDNFMEIIGNVASKYGVVAGLVHNTTDFEEFRKVMRISERARLFMIADDKWQEWVLSYIKKASVIIIDLENTTEGVMWEVEKSKEICGEEHVIILDKDFWKGDNSDFKIESQKNELERKLEIALKYR